MDPSQGNTDAPLNDSNFLSPTTYVATGGEESERLDESIAASQPEEELREQDRFLPIANVARIMKKGIPTSGKIAKEAKECCQECVSEFISFITSEASDRCSQEKRKTINGEDILYAMSTLSFDNYVEPLKLFLQKYRDSTKAGGSSGAGTSEIEVPSNPMFAGESSGAMMASNILSGDQAQQPLMYAATYPNQFISGAQLDND